jgi:hypothetical protein
VAEGAVDAALPAAAPGPAAHDLALMGAVDACAAAAAAVAAEAVVAVAEA